MKNYLMLLGWVPGEDREILLWEEVAAGFRLEQVNHFLAAIVTPTGFAEFVAWSYPGHSTPRGEWPAPTVAHQLGINPARLTVAPHNTASCTVIERNGGTLIDQASGRLRYELPTTP